MYSCDPLKSFYRKDKAQTDWENSLPKCCRCKHPIQDERYYKIHEEIYHAECMDEEFGVDNQFL